MKRFFIYLAVLIFAGSFVIPQNATASDDIDVLIGCAKPYGAIVAQIEALGGTVRFQYNHVDGIAATIPNDHLGEIQGMAGVTSFRRDLTISLEDPPALSRQGFGEVQSKYTFNASDLSGDLAAFTTAAPDGYFPTEVNLTRASDFWSATGHFGEGVIVGIMDTGTADVAAISGRVIGGENFTGDGIGANDPGNDPHGTWVATTLGANVIFGFLGSGNLAQSLKTHLPGAIIPDFFAPGIDGVPMVGQAPLAQFFALKIFNVSGSTSNSIILAAFDRTIDLKQQGIVDIQVLNGSFGGASLFAADDPFFAGMVSELQAAGIVTCFSAGNSGPSGMTGGDPGLARNNITVGASAVAAYEKILRDLQFGLGIGSLFRANNTHQTAFFSSRGPTADGRVDPDITAPGFAIFAQAANGGINIVSGTSFSSPNVAGGAALLLSAHPGATPDQIRAALLNGADPNVLEDNSGPNDQGFGFMDVLAAHAAFGSANPADVGKASPDVKDNISKIKGIKVISGNNFTAGTGDLLPGQRSEIFYRIKKNTESVTITISGVTPELPAGQQNPLFGDDIMVSIVSAKTAFDDARAGTPAFVGTGGATFVLTGSDLDEGIARITLMGDWTNAGEISATVNITRTERGPEGSHQDGFVAQGDFAAATVNVPVGATELSLRLTWDDHWGRWPTDDLDMFVLDPVGNLVLLDNDGDGDTDGLSLDAPERLNITNPAGGVWTVFVNGFTVWTGEERFRLFADVVAPLPSPEAGPLALGVTLAPTEFQLGPNFPNPFNPTTFINYDLAAGSHVSLQIFNITGQLVRTLVDGVTSAGSHSVLWDGKDNSGQTAPSGTYIYRIQADNFQQTRKMVLLK